MSENFPKRTSSGGRVKVELDLSNYATKTDLKDLKKVGTSKCPKRVDLANLKSNVDKLDNYKLENVPTNLRNFKSKVDKSNVDELIPAPVNLSKLSDEVKNDVVYMLYIYIYNAKIKNIEHKIPDITNLATNALLNAKINMVKGEIASITDLATTTAITAVENKYLKSVI